MFKQSSEEMLEKKGIKDKQLHVKNWGKIMLLSDKMYWD